MSAFVHTTVLLEETVAGVLPRPGGVYVDVTLGGGGHAEALLEASAPDGRVIGVDRDPAALDAAGARLARHGGRVTLVHGAFGDLRAILSRLGAAPVDGVVADLGVSSPQLDVPERGFSFRVDAPLDMRMDTTAEETASTFLARVDELELTDVLARYGEERRAKAIARSILRARDEGKLETTGDVRRAVVRVLGPRKHGDVDPATRTFQALRIAVNRELDELEQLLAVLPDVVTLGGAVAIISFHSLEDRLVKRALRDDLRWSPTSKKPVVASEGEARENPRARSAKLRIARRVVPELRVGRRNKYPRDAQVAQGDEEGEA